MLGKKLFWHAVLTLSSLRARLPRQEEGNKANLISSSPSFNRRLRLGV